MQLNRCINVSLNLSRSPLALFNGSTNQMSMFSLTLLFVELRVLRRRSVHCPQQMSHQQIS
jgi:hypothetical protein